MNYRRLRQRIHGPVYPIPTPFTDDYRVDVPALEKYVDFLIEGGARILHVMVHTSRFNLLTIEEMKLVNATVAKRAVQVNPDCIAIAATPTLCSTATAREFAVHARDNGADVIGVIFPERFYSDDQVLSYFGEVADAADIGILIHEELLRTIHGCVLTTYPTELLERIAAIAGVVAIKEDAKDDTYNDRVVSRLYDKLAIIVSGGSKKQFLKFHPMGCHAYLVGVASFWPGVALDFYRALSAGDLPEALSIIENLEQPFFAVAKRLGWHIALKSALQQLGIMSATERPPLQALDRAGHQEIADCLALIRTEPGSVTRFSPATSGDPVLRPLSLV